MRQTSVLIKQRWQRFFTSSLTVVVSLLSLFIFIQQPSYATIDKSLTPQEQIDRAYEFSEVAGLREETYQQRLQEGQDPESMPKPYRRVKDAEGRTIPETSTLEKSIDKARGLVEGLTNK